MPKKRTRKDAKNEIDIDLSTSSDEDAPPLKKARKNPPKRRQTKRGAASKPKPFNPKKYTVEAIENGDYSEQGASNEQNLCCFGALFHLQSFDATNNKLSRILFESKPSITKYAFITEKYLIYASRGKMTIADITSRVNDDGRDKYNQRERQITADIICEHALADNDANAEVQKQIDTERQNKRTNSFGFGSVFGGFNDDGVKVNVIATDVNSHYAVFDRGDNLYCVRLLLMDTQQNNENTDNTNVNNSNQNDDMKEQQMLRIVGKFDISQLGSLKNRYKRNQTMQQMLLWRNAKDEMNVIIFAKQLTILTINLSTNTVVESAIYLQSNYKNPAWKSVKLYENNKAVVCGQCHEFGILQLNENGKHKVIARIMTKYFKKNDAYLRCGIWSNYCVIGAFHDNRIGIWDLEKKELIKYVRISSASGKQKFNCWRIYALKEYKSFVALCATEDDEFIWRIYPKQ